MNSLFKSYNRYLLNVLIGIFLFHVLKTCRLFDNQFVDWGLTYSLIFLIVIKLTQENRFLLGYNLIIDIYLIWTVIGALRGFLVAENYWEFKNLISNIRCLLLPLFALLFYQPSYVLAFFQRWNRFIPLLLVLFITNFARRSQIHLLMGPIYFLLGCYIQKIPSKKWKFFVVAFLCLMLADIGDRSQVIKAALSLAVSFAIPFDRYIPKFLIQIAGLSLYFAAVLFLYLGITGQYNVFNHTIDKTTWDVTFTEGTMDAVAEKNKNMADTRSFIYEEVLMSALINDYIWLGRTPARGNDSEAFGYQMIADHGPEAKPERNSNELCHLNIFTWLGLIGVILYSIIYLLASFLGLFFSNNSYLRYLSVVIAFHWLYGWVENINLFNFQNIGQWMIIGMCISPEFRKLSNAEFVLWFKSLFSKEKLTEYHKLQLVRYLIKYKELKKVCNEVTNRKSLVYKT